MKEELFEMKLLTIVVSFVILATVALNFFDKPELNDLCKIAVAGYIGYCGRNTIGGTK